MLASDVKATVGGHGAVVAFVGSDNLAVFADSVDLGPFPEGVQTTTARRFDATRGAIAKVSLDRLKGPQLVLQAELIELSHNDGRLTPLAWPVFLRATKKAFTPLTLAGQKFPEAWLFDPELAASLDTASNEALAALK